MNTDELISRLQEEAATRPRPSAMGWPIVVVGAVLVACLALAFTVGVRPDILDAAQTVRFNFKFVLTAILALSAVLSMRELARPAGEKRRLAILLVPLVLMTGAVIIELIVVPSDRWLPRLIGSNSRACLTLIPLFGAVPLALFLHASRARAPTRPMLQGGLCGLGAASVAAFFYAAQCTDDSPLFVATWYSLATAILVGAGALLGRRLLRW